MSCKKRLDLVLIDKGFFSSRRIAQTNVMCGNVLVNGIKVLKCGEKISDDDSIQIINQRSNFYVSRGGLKLKKAIDEFHIDLSNKICFDIGASTGGFTDCMLNEGAKKVFAIDVGYGQLAYKLRTDDRVVVLERTNVRYIDKSFFDTTGDFASIDVSFISIEKIICNVRSFLSDTANMVALIKPQFEAGKGKVSKRGIVKDKEIHFEVLHRVLNFLRNNNFGILGLTSSPIRGGDGNIEFLVYISLDSFRDSFSEEYIWDVINLSHKSQNFD